MEEIADIAASGEARVAVIVDPNNPDGRTHPLPARLALAEAMAARGGLLVVDEAFADLEPVESLCPQVRPASWCCAPSARPTAGGPAPRLRRRRSGDRGPDRGGAGPLGGLRPALEIGTAALSDEAWRAEQARARGADAARLDRMILRAGGRVVGGTCLFRTADFPDGPGLYRRLAEAGIAVRRFEARAERLRFAPPPRSRVVPAVAVMRGRANSE